MTYQEDIIKDQLDARMRLARQVGYLKGSLQRIADLPPGNRGAHSKFAEAQEIANRALANFEQESSR